MQDNLAADLADFLQGTDPVPRGWHDTEGARRKVRQMRGGDWQCVQSGGRGRCSVCEMKDEDRARSGGTLHLGQVSFPLSKFHIISFSISSSRLKTFVIHAFKHHCLFLLLCDQKKYLNMHTQRYSRRK